MKFKVVPIQTKGYSILQEDGHEGPLPNFSVSMPTELANLFALAPEMLEALKKIKTIENQSSGSDWDEIELARDIASKVLVKL